MGSESKVEYFIQGLNAQNTKKVALILVIAFIIVHGLHSECSEPPAPDTDSQAALSPRRI